MGYRRGQERTFYTATEGESFAIKVYDRGLDDNSLPSTGGRLETATQEAEMLEAARSAGIDVAVPVAVNRSEDETFLVKNAGNPEDGEVPYWITDLGYLGQSGEYDESDVESHLADAMEKSMRQIMELQEQGIVHRSLTPMSHRENHGFSIYEDFLNVRYLSPEVNFTPTGELKDFEHAERPPGDTQNIGDPIAETVLTYLWTATGAGLDNDTAASVVAAPIDELSVDYDIAAPEEANLRTIAGYVSNFALSTGQNPERAQGRMPAWQIKNVVHQITEDDDIDGFETSDPSLDIQAQTTSISSSHINSYISSETTSQSTTGIYDSNSGKLKKYKIEDDTGVTDYLE